MAAHLGFVKADIEAIEYPDKKRMLHYRSYCSNKVMTLYILQEWKTKEGIDRATTYRVLLEALIKCKCLTSAEQLCSK